MLIFHLGSTHNHLSIPTVKSETCTIAIMGKVVLSLSYCGEGKDWS